MSIRLPTTEDPVSVCRADVLDFLTRLPDDGVDLLFTSPPYELARTYGIKDKMVGGQAWVDWMVAVVRAAAPKVKGLIAVNCEGQTRGYRYSCAPFLLIADLHRAGFNLRKPCVYERDGIPGSGGPDWLKNRWEPIVCVTRPGRLPWSDNTACGHAPKYGPGGDPSHRTVNGVRVAHKFESMSSRGTDGKRKMGGGRRLTATRGGRDGDTQTGIYSPPDLANPGNIIDCGSAGGGNIGHDLAHENEAPFPLELASFFVKSFCPPDGVVCDPFMGSGTVAHAAVIAGRRFVGCDVRESQVELTAKRLAEPLGMGGLFASPEPVVRTLYDDPEGPA